MVRALLCCVFAFQLLAAQGADKDSGKKAEISKNKKSEKKSKKKKAVKKRKPTLASVAEDGNLKQVKEFLAKGIAVDQKDIRGYTPLFLAVYRGHLAVVKHLVSLKASVQFREPRRNAPLSLAAISNRKSQKTQAAMLALLLKNGLDVNATDKKGTSALLLASSRRLTSIVELLIKNKANVNIDSGKVTPLWQAVNKNSLAITNLLIKAKANVNTLGPRGASPLTLASQNNNTAMVKTLVKAGAAVNHSPAKDGRTPLHFAVQNGNLGMINELIKARADINAREKLGLSPLWYALSGRGSRYERCALALVEAGANLLEKNKKQETALMIAAHKGWTKLAMALVNKKVDINAKNKKGHTALQFAVSEYRTGTAEALIKAGANVNTRNNEGTTPLMFAAQDGNVKMARLLIKNKADVNAKDNDGSTALFYALLKSNAASQRVIAVLLSSRADPNLANGKGQSPLVYASRYSNKAIEELLKKHGAKK